MLHYKTITDSGLCIARCICSHPTLPRGSGHWSGEFRWIFSWVTGLLIRKQLNFDVLTDHDPDLGMF